MKNVINNSTYSVLLVPLIAMFSIIGTINAQNTIQNKQQSTNTVQRFIDVDTNNDGFISQDEYQFGPFNEFDTDKDGRLSRNEYRDKNRALNRNIVGNGKAGINNGKGNGQTQRGNGKGQRIGQGNGQKNGTGVCPYGNQCPRKKSGTKTRGRRAT
ncbi:MAG: hypothetical protein WBM98_07905 [Maribacter sp.]|uniref:hypothetical protein n=1 Tax=Maribacter sp. TaxID=1897614 RepID=UPI003C76FABF